MKANAGQIGTAIDRAGNGGGDIRLFLLHGPDEAQAMDYAARLGRAMGQEAERVDVEASALKGRPGLLADEAASMSLFGGPRWVRVTGIGDDAIDAIEALLAIPAAGNPVIAIGPSLKGTGKLVKFATGAPGAMVCALYQPDARDAARNTAATAREHGLRLMGDTASAMVDAAGGDRAVIAREIEKLALYLDAAPDRPKEADLAALDAIGANLPDTGMFDAIEAIVDGRPMDLGTEQARFDPTMTIPLLRNLAKRLITLAEMRADVDGGASIDETIERRRVFWKEKAATSRALRRWSSAQLATAIGRVRAAERGLLAPGTAGTILADTELMTIARAAARFG